MSHVPTDPSTEHPLEEENTEEKDAEALVAEDGTVNLPDCCCLVCHSYV